MEVLNKWHRAIETRDPSLLDEILADDVVFYSPVLWSKQEGKTITKMYLTAALHVLANNDFKYVREIVSGNHACLEFTTKIDDTIINGVDLITVNENSKIIEFKVMVRPIRGMMAVKEKMFELLQKLNS